jgi:hypothetical protein
MKRLLTVLLLASGLAAMVGKNVESRERDGVSAAQHRDG